jgi:hypothetical protein
MENRITFLFFAKVRQKIRAFNREFFVNRNLKINKSVNFFKNPKLLSFNDGQIARKDKIPG